MGMKTFLKRFRSEDNAQDMVEYALLLGFIVLCAAVVLTNTRTQISAIWSTISSSLSSAVSNATS
jgi:Flp pilus assembly pilin Flp